VRSWVKKVHFVGIGGAGMCGIAEVLFNLEFEVSGSDLQENINTRRLKTLGVPVNIGHKAELVKGVDVVVISSAVDSSNPEVVAALEEKIPVVPRAEMLGELMRLQHGVAVAGTHGKTTTTSLIVSVLAEAKMDPTFVIGGRLNSAGANARLGKGEYLVAEADESDASFMHLHPFIAVVTNIDQDHMGTYGGDFEKLKRTFVAFLHNLPFYGMAVLCVEDPVVKEILADVHKPTITYGFSEDADVVVRNLEQNGLTTRFTVDMKGDKDWLDITIHQPGKHSVLNAVAAICVAHILGVDKSDIGTGLENFQGIARRMQLNGELDYEDGSVIFIDDYAHHPTEISATLQAVTDGWPDRRLVVVFQPHRYSRTHDLLDDFSAVLSTQNHLVITEVYAAGEEPIAGADGRALCRSIRARGRVDPVFIEDMEELPETLGSIVQANDIVLTMGAGNIGQVAADLPRKLHGVSAL